MEPGEFFRFYVEKSNEYQSHRQNRDIPIFCIKIGSKVLLISLSASYITVYLHSVQIWL